MIQCLKPMYSLFRGYDARLYRFVITDRLKAELQTGKPASLLTQRGFPNLLRRYNYDVTSQKVRGMNKKV